MSFEGFAQRLNLALKRNHTNAKVLALQAGLKPGTLYAILRNETKDVKWSTLTTLAKHLKVDPIWLVEGTEPTAVRVLDINENPGQDYVQVPEYSVSFGCGEGAPDLISWEISHKSVPTTFKKSFFDRLGINYKNCKRIRASGNSMQPLIQNGDYVTVDCTPGQKIIDGEIYAFADLNGVHIKRLYNIENGLLIKSDNPTFPDTKLVYDECQSFNLLGRVIERSGSLI